MLNSTYVTINSINYSAAYELYETLHTRVQSIVDVWEYKNHKSGKIRWDVCTIRHSFTSEPKTLGLIDPNKLAKLSGQITISSDVYERLVNCFESSFELSIIVRDTCGLHPSIVKSTTIEMSEISDIYITEALDKLLASFE